MPTDQENPYYSFLRSSVTADNCYRSSSGYAFILNQLDPIQLPNLDLPIKPHITVFENLSIPMDLQNAQWHMRLITTHHITFPIRIDGSELKIRFYYKGSTLIHRQVKNVNTPHHIDPSSIDSLYQIATKTSDHLRDKLSRACQTLESRYAELEEKAESISSELDKGEPLKNALALARKIVTISSLVGLDTMRRKFYGIKRILEDQLGIFPWTNETNSTHSPTDIVRASYKYFPPTLETGEYDRFESQESPLKIDLLQHEYTEPECKSSPQDNLTKKFYLLLHAEPIDLNALHNELLSVRTILSDTEALILLESFYFECCQALAERTHTEENWDNEILAITDLIRQLHQSSFDTKQRELFYAYFPFEWALKLNSYRAMSFFEEVYSQEIKQPRLPGQLPFFKELPFFSLLSLGVEAPSLVIQFLEKGYFLPSSMDKKQDCNLGNRNFKSLWEANNKVTTIDASHGERSDGEYSAKGVDFVRQRSDGGLSLRSP